MFLTEAAPARRAFCEKTGELPPPWGRQVLAETISTAFLASVTLAAFAVLIALFVVRIRRSGLDALNGTAAPGGYRGCRRRAGAALTRSRSLARAPGPGAGCPLPAHRGHFQEQGLADRAPDRKRCSAAGPRTRTGAAAEVQRRSGVQFPCSGTHTGSSSVRSSQAAGGRPASPEATTPQAMAQVVSTSPPA
jgi:hypothetical protein